MTAAAHTHRQAGWWVDQFVISSVGLCLKWRMMSEHRSSEMWTSNPSLGGVGVTGVQAGLCRCRGAAALGSRWAVEGLRAPPEVLQGLQKGAACPLFLKGGGPFFFYLCDLGEGDGLCFEASLPRATGAALALCWDLWDRQLLGELLHSRGHQVSWQDVKAGGFHCHLTHSSHGRAQVE